MDLSAVTMRFPRIRPARLVLLIVVLIAARAAGSAEEPKNEPRPCVGFNFVSRRWGIDWGGADPVCPPQFGFFSAANPMVSGPRRRSPLWENCCPLPSADIVLSEFVLAPDICPEGFIVTGTVPDLATGDNLLHCNRINAARYALGRKYPGVYWGVGSEISLWYHRLPALLARSSLPASLRTGIARQGMTEWRISGCVGYPFGTLLVGVGERYCHQFTFRELEYRGAPGDPPAGTPVKMLPDCEQISDIFDPDAVCRMPGRRSGG